MLLVTAPRPPALYGLRPDNSPELATVSAELSPASGPGHRTRHRRRCGPAAL